uniref:Uncharacterized protein n=1 Tax=Anopheles coluzzii TaxID=1518534 RepID=A0A8W7PYW4_ANOCL
MQRRSYCSCCSSQRFCSAVSSALAAASPAPTATEVFLPVDTIDTETAVVVLGLSVVGWYAWTALSQRAFCCRLCRMHWVQWPRLVPHAGHFVAQLRNLTLQPLQLIDPFLQLPGPQPVQLAHLIQLLEQILVFTPQRLHHPPIAERRPTGGHEAFQLLALLVQLAAQSGGYGALLFVPFVRQLVIQALQIALQIAQLALQHVPSVRTISSSARTVARSRSSCVTNRSDSSRQERSFSSSSASALPDLLRAECIQLGYVAQHFHLALLELTLKRLLAGVALGMFSLDGGLVGAYLFHHLLQQFYLLVELLPGAVYDSCSVFCSSAKVSHFARAVSSSDRVTRTLQRFSFGVCFFERFTQRSHLTFKLFPPLDVLFIRQCRLLRLFELLAKVFIVLHLVHQLRRQLVVLGRLCRKLFPPLGNLLLQPLDGRLPTVKLRFQLTQLHIARFLQGTLFLLQRANGFFQLLDNFDQLLDGFFLPQHGRIAVEHGSVSVSIFETIAAVGCCAVAARFLQRFDQLLLASLRPLPVALELELDAGVLVPVQFRLPYRCLALLGRQGEIVFRLANRCHLALQFNL